MHYTEIIIEFPKPMPRYLLANESFIRINMNLWKSIVVAVKRFIVVRVGARSRDAANFMV